MVVPSELNACVRSSRLDAVSGLPSNHHVRIGRHLKTSDSRGQDHERGQEQRERSSRGGRQKQKRPTAMVSRPATIVLWYPIAFTNLDHGSENRK